MFLPPHVVSILEALERQGHAAWCVGGCVRDSLLHRTPEDWDVTTSALPEQVMALFAPHAFPTGLRHGTVTIRRLHQVVEVTTFRSDGPYGDSRRPDTVSFTDSLEADLARRDFTVNAMAVDLQGRFADPFGGQQDLDARRLCCVGRPGDRFREDALRILRCLRFSAVLGFSVAEETAEALMENRRLLERIAPERVRMELDKLLVGQDAPAVLRAFPAAVGVVLPEVLPMVGFHQHNRHHCFDVWEHTLHALEAAPPERALRWAVLLHDVGKPAAFTMDDWGQGHFFGHPALGKTLAGEALHRLKFDNASRDAVLTLVEWHDREILPTERAVRRVLQRLGEARLRQLLAVKRADNLGQAPAYRGRQAEIDRVEAVLDHLLAENACFSRKQLAVNGGDLAALGLEGRQIGATLSALLDAVVEGDLPNERAALLAAAQSRRSGS